jgi:hypothetical protein
MPGTEVRETGCENGGWTKLVHQRFQRQVPVLLLHCLLDQYILCEFIPILVVSTEKFKLRYPKLNTSELMTATERLFKLSNLHVVSRDVINQWTNLYETKHIKV